MMTPEQELAYLRQEVARLRKENERERNLKAVYLRTLVALDRFITTVMQHQQ
jgi:hypothetical protein